MYPNHSPSRHEAPSGTIGPAARAGRRGQLRPRRVLRAHAQVVVDPRRHAGGEVHALVDGRGVPPGLRQAGGDEDQRGHRHERPGPPAGPLGRRVLRFRRERFGGAVDDEGHRGLIGGDRADGGTPGQPTSRSSRLSSLISSGNCQVLEAEIGRRVVHLLGQRADEPAQLLARQTQQLLPASPSIARSLRRSLPGTGAVSAGRRWWRGCR